MWIRLLVLGATLSACSGSDMAVESRATEGCGIGERASLTLLPHSVRPLPAAMVPAALLLLPDGSLLVADRGSAGISLYRPGEAKARWLPAPEPLPVLTRAGNHVFAAGTDAVYRIDTSSGRVARVAGVPVRAGRVVSLAADENTLWAVTGGVGAGLGGVYATDLESPGTWRYRVLEAPAQLEALGTGRVAAALTRAPHQVLVLDSALNRLGTARPDPPRRRADQEESAFTQALIALDCGWLLHVVSDLRSDRRDMILYQTVPDLRLIRTQTIQRPIGFVHALDGGTLVAVSEAEGRREVVQFNWSWQSNQEGT